MALWSIKFHKDGEADRNPMSIGDLVTYREEFWTVTGYSEPDEVVWIGRDDKLIACKAEDLGLVWGTY